MASVSGSQLTFLAPNKERVNLILNDGKTISGTTVKGAFNIEVFTVAPGKAMKGVDGTAFIEGAVKVDSNTVEAGTLGSTEQLGFGAYTLIDDTDHKSLNQHKAPQGEKIELGSGAQTVIGSSGDTITGGNADKGRQVIDLTGRNHDVTSGPMTAIGGAGKLLVEAGFGDSITGGSGPITIVGGMPSEHGRGSLDEDGNDHGRGHSRGDHGNDEPAGGNGDQRDDKGKSSGGSHDVITQGTGAMTVDGGFADTVNGSMASGAGSLTIRDLGASSSVTGGSGDLTMIDFGKHESIAGGSGLNVIDDKGHGGDSSIIGGTGTVTGAGGQAVNTLIVSEKGDSVSGRSGSLSVDGGVGGATITAGTTATTVDGGNRDVINNNDKGTLLVDIFSRDGGHNASTMGSGSETVDLSKGHGATTLRDTSVAGHKGQAAETSVTGFSTTTDAIASKTSVDATGTFLGHSTTAGGNTTLTFLDGSQMTLIGVTNVNDIKFTQ